MNAFLNHRHLRTRVITWAAFAMTLASLGLSGCTKKIDDKDTTFNWVLRANVPGLDPAHSNNLYSTTVVEQIHEGLFQYSFLKRPYQLEPALADGMPTVSADGLTYTFKIKAGVRFQDDPCFANGKGRELTAEDFIYSWKRLADPKNLSEGFWIFDGKIKGINDWANLVKDGKATYDTPIAGLHAPDAHTLVISLTAPYAQLSYILATPYSFAVPKEAVEKYGKEYLNHPVGTGPYRLESWVRNSKLILVKNATWRGEAYPSDGSPEDKANGFTEDAGKTLPFSDKIILTELVEASPRWQNFQRGNFDAAEIPPDAFESAVKDKKIAPELAAKGVKLNVVAGADVTFTVFNLKDPILGKNKNLRHAISLAQDNATFVHNFYNDRATLAQTPIPPDFATYDPAYKNPWLTFNIVKAKELLAKAGYPDGKGMPTLQYETLSDSKSRQQAEFFAQNLNAIGLTVSINSNTWPQFQDKIKQGRAQIFGIAWAADYPDPQNFYQLFYSKNMSPGPNESSFSNADYDRLYEKSLSLSPGSERDAIYLKMRDIVVEESPWMFIAHRDIYRAYHSWLHNFKPNEIHHGYFKYLRIDPKARAELKPKL